MVCEEVGDISMGFDWFLAVLTIPCAYFPQMLKFCQAKSHVGVSFSNLCCICFCNSMLVSGYLSSKYEETFSCCDAEHSVRQCMGRLGPLVQCLLSLFGGWLVVVFYATFFDRPGLVGIGRDAAACLKRERWQAAALITLTLLEAAVLGSLAGAAGTFESAEVKLYGDVVNVVLCLFIAMHWSLQLYETWRLRGLGSLSVFAMTFTGLGAALTGVMFVKDGAVATGVSQWICSSFCFAIIIVGTCFKRPLLGTELLSARE